MNAKLIIRGELPSLNEYTTANRTNKFAGAKMKTEAEHLIRLHIAEQMPKIKFKEPVYVAYNWVCRNKRKDKDNVAFAKKFIQDALVRAGVIQNDGWNYIIGWTDSFDVDPTNPRTEVTISEIEP